MNADAQREAPTDPKGVWKSDHPSPLVRAGYRAGWEGNPLLLAG